LLVLLNIRFFSFRLYFKPIKGKIKNNSSPFKNHLFQCIWFDIFFAKIFLIKRKAFLRMKIRKNSFPHSGWIKSHHSIVFEKVFEK